MMGRMVGLPGGSNFMHRIIRAASFTILTAVLAGVAWGQTNGGTYTLSSGSGSPLGSVLGLADNGSGSVRMSITSTATLTNSSYVFISGVLSLSNTCGSPPCPDVPDPDADRK